MVTLFLSLLLFLHDYLTYLVAFDRVLSRGPGCLGVIPTVITISYMKVRGLVRNISLTQSDASNSKHLLPRHAYRSPFCSFRSPRYPRGILESRNVASRSSVSIAVGERHPNFAFMLTSPTCKRVYHAMLTQSFCPLSPYSSIMCYQKATPTLTICLLITWNCLHGIPTFHFLLMTIKSNPSSFSVGIPT